MIFFKKFRSSNGICRSFGRIFLFSSILFFQSVGSPTTLAAQGNRPPFLNTASATWADSILTKMSLAEKLGQLFMVDAFSNKDSTHVQKIQSLIRDFHIGGLIFFQGGPERQRSLTESYQAESAIPLLIGIDGEWGLQMRLDSTLRFPRQMTLGAGSSEEDVYAMGVSIGEQCRRLGIHVNFAPTIDINNNPLNPIINSRSFGEDKELVATLGNAYMRGMQDKRVLACAKHFPGHGNTDTDSHHVLPVVNSDRKRLDTLELFPFIRLIDDGVGSIMVAHLFVPAIEPTADLAGSLSREMVGRLLKDSLRFEGVVFTDALNMKGVANYFAPGEIELKALQAGNDVLLYSQDIPAAFSRIMLALQNGELDSMRIHQSARKVLQVKHWAGLDRGEIRIPADDLVDDLNGSDAQWLAFQLFDKAPVLLSNKHNTIPLHPHPRYCFASLVMQDSADNLFQRQLSKYADVDCFSLPRDATNEEIDSLVEVLSGYDRVVLSIHNTSTNASRRFGVSNATVSMVKRFSKKRGAVLVVFGNPYILSRLEGVPHYHAVVQAFEDTRFPNIQIAQKLFGADVFQGRMPVSVPPYFKIHDGKNSQLIGGLRSTLPAGVSIGEEFSSKVDSMVSEAIRDSIFPGCQVLFAKNGKVFFEKAYGKHTYDGPEPVELEDVYDLASITKVASTALAVMYLVDQHKLDPDAKVSRYLPYLRHTDKGNLTIRQLLLHESGLKAWHPFWKETVDHGVLSDRYYRSTVQCDFTTPVAKDIYIRDDYREKVWEEIVASKLDPAGKMVYSDLGLLVLQRIIEKITGEDLREFVQERFYKPMGLWRVDYLPLQRHALSDIVPTEYDTAFRQQLVHGFVHDPTAAMLGGVAGHAGLFSDVRSVAVIMQMLIDSGMYAGHRYIRPETVKLFTSRVTSSPANRRGLLFDKPDLANANKSPAAPSASSAAFGHTGFTGTTAWADPTNGMVFVFLSNRVHPSSVENRLAKSSFRTRLMQLGYDALKK